MYRLIVLLKRYLHRTHKPSSSVVLIALTQPTLRGRQPSILAYTLKTDTMSGTPISPVGASRPELTLSPAAINSEPVELDGNPTSPEKVKADLHGSQQAKLEELSPEEREVCRQSIVILTVSTYTALEKSEAHLRPEKGRSSSRRSATDTRR